jgi:hypothetical protein
MSIYLLASSSKSWSAVRGCRTPEKVTAAVATPRLLWGEKRRERMAAGEKSQGRNRGKGAQLRRRLRRQQDGIDKWRLEERKARIMVAVAAAEQAAEEKAVLARAWAEGRVLRKELRRDEQEQLRRDEQEQLRRDEQEKERSRIAGREEKDEEQDVCASGGVVSGEEKQRAWSVQIQQTVDRLHALERLASDEVRSRREKERERKREKEQGGGGRRMSG